MSTIFKTRISQQEVQAPTVSADRVVTDNFITSSIQSESVASENINATTVQGEEIIANDLSTENIAISNDLSIGQDVIVPSGNVLVGRKGIVSFVDDGEEVDENGASGFPIYNGVPEVLNNSTVYNIGEIDKDIDLSNIRFGGNDNMVQTCEIWFSTPAETARSVGDTYEITWPENIVWLDSTDGNAPAIVKGTEYRIVLRKENEQIVASIAYAIGEGQQSVDEMIRDAAQKDGDNTFTGANTFTGSVDMSTAQVTPPEGWNVGELTAEQVQAVVPMAFGEYTTSPRITKGSVAFGSETYTERHNVAIGYKASAPDLSTVIGYDAKGQINSVSVGNSVRSGVSSITIGHFASTTNTGYSTSVGYLTSTKKNYALTIGSYFQENVDGSTVTHTCTTEGTGSITIGAGANTLNTTTTVDGVETTVESSNSVTIGCKAENKGADSVVIGAQANNNKGGGIAIGTGSYGGYLSVSVGTLSKGSSGSVAIGSQANGESNGVAIGYQASTNAYGGSVAVGFMANAGMRGTSIGSVAVASNDATALGCSSKANAVCTIAIGAGATITNTAAADGTVTPSENTIVIGYGATASAPNSVVMGAGASGPEAESVVIGTGAGDETNLGKSVCVGNSAKTSGYQGGTAVGYSAGASYYGTAIGYDSEAWGSATAVGTLAKAVNGAIAVGKEARANSETSIAIGDGNTVEDKGVAAFLVRDSWNNSTAKTKLYFVGANTPLANEYYNGEAFMGYTVTDSAGTKLACGTRRLSELFPDNSLTQPASLDENGEWVMPKVFHPSDLDLPVEEPTEPEDATINIPEPTLPEAEEYIPLPVYPIVEPELEEI